MQWKERWVRHLAGIGSYWNVGLSVFCLVPILGTIAATNILVNYSDLQTLLASSFRFDDGLTLEATSAIYVFAVTIVGFFCVAVVAIVVCIQAQLAAAPPGRRRRGGLIAAFTFAVSFVAGIIAERLFDSQLRTPGFLFASAFESAFDKQQSISSNLLATFDRIQWLFQMAIATVVAAYTFAAAAAGACAGPSPDGAERSTNLMRSHVALQMARHHRIFYAASAVLLVMLLVGKTHLDVYEALLNDVEGEAGKVMVRIEGGTAVANMEVGKAMAGMKELRLGIEVYWGAILSVSLAAIYVPAALVHHYRLRRAGEVNVDRPSGTGGIQALQVDSAAKIAMRIGLVLLPSVFSGGVGELVTAIVQ